VDVESGVKEPQGFCKERTLSNRGFETPTGDKGVKPGPKKRKSRKKKAEGEAVGKQKTAVKRWAQ
jgi:hypothetical protein